jgi:exoribonuclease-2
MLETYWALRWLVQENVKEIGGTVLRENLVSLEGLPLTTRVSSLPTLNPETAVRLAIDEIDLIECKALCHWVPAEPGGVAGKELQQAQS